MRYGVVGLGMTGQSVLRHLPAEQVAWAWDTREDFDLTGLRQSHPDIRFHAGALPDAAWDEVDALVVSPGLAMADPLLAPARVRALPIVGDIELFARAVDRPVIAITGSNGKSTVTTLVAEMLNASGIRAVAGGNLGTPALDLLNRPVDLYVLELSSFQLETTRSLAPSAAALLNVSEDHMDRYDGMDDYVAAKARIFSNARRAVVPPELAALADGVPERVRFDLTPPAAEADFGVATGWLVRGETRLMPVSELPLPMAHMQKNVLAALALVRPFVTDLSPALDVARGFSGLPHRTEQVAVRDGVRWVNDSKGTNVGATVAALESFAALGPVVLVAGGVGKGQDFSPLRTAAARACRAVVTYGVDGPRIAEALEGAVPVTQRKTLEEALHVARSQARPGDTVLLSPACASFDQFANYQARGEAFRQWVEEHV